MLFVAALNCPLVAARLSRPKRKWRFGCCGRVLSGGGRGQDESHSSSQLYSFDGTVCAGKLFDWEGRGKKEAFLLLAELWLVVHKKTQTHTHTQNPPPTVVPTWIRTLGCTRLMCRRTSGSALRHAPYFTRRRTHPGCTLGENTHSVLSARKHIEPKPHWNTNGLPKERARTLWLTHSDTERGFLARAPYGQVWCLIDQGEREEATGTLHICACQQSVPEGEWGGWEAPTVICTTHQRIQKKREKRIGSDMMDDMTENNYW